MNRIASIMAMGKTEVEVVGGDSTLLTGLRVYYALSDTSDATGGGQTLTNNNSATFGTGKVNNAATFVSASSQWLSRAENAAFQMGSSTDFTMAAWVKFTSVTGARVSVYGYVNENGYGIGIATDEIVCKVYDGTNTAQVNTGTTYNDGNWHLAIMTANRAGNLTLYVDNVLKGTPASMAGMGAMDSPSDYGFSIGAEVLGGSAKLDGSVDEVGIWDRVLTGAEIGALWNGGVGLTYPFAFSPTAIAGLELWLKADSLSLSDNDPVATWADSSGSGNTAGQATSGNRPVYKTSIVNGKPVVRFTSSSSQFMSLTTGLSGATDFTAFVVMKSAGGSYMPSLGSAGHDGVYGPARLGTTLYVAVSDGASGYVFSYGALDTSFHVITVLRSLDLYVDGVFRSYSYIGNGSHGTINSVGFGGASYGDGDIAEILYYDSNLSSDDRGSVEGYLSDKYGL